MAKTRSASAGDADTEQAVAQLRSRDAARRIVGAVLLVAAGGVLPLLAAGDEGALIGAIVGAITLCVLTVALWPWEWDEQERVHHELAWIWRQVRGREADEPVAWERYVAWAEPAGGEVELQLISCRRDSRVGDAPGPLSRVMQCRLAAEDMEGAAEAMEELRVSAAERERESRERHELGAAQAEIRADEAKLTAIDTQAEAEIFAREERLRQEFAEQEAADQRAQADALAKALRRP